MVLLQWTNITITMYQTMQVCDACAENGSVAESGLFFIRFVIHGEKKEKEKEKGERYVQLIASSPLIFFCFYIFNIYLFICNPMVDFVHMELTIE